MKKQPRTNKGISIVLNGKINLDQKMIQTTCDFFKDGDVIIHYDIHKNKITFTKPTIDYNGKLYKVSKYKTRPLGFRSYLSIGISSEELPLGKFLFDKEESNEDCKVVYFQ